MVDFGGVLTTSIWPAFAAFCEGEGLAPDAVRELFRGDPEALALLRGLETGELDDAEFERRFGELLGVADARGPDHADVRRARARAERCSPRSPRRAPPASGPA